MEYKELFENAWNNSVATFTFKLKSGNDGLNFRSIDELTDTYVTLSNTVSSFKLYFNKLEYDTIVLEGIEYPVVYSDDYFNYRFIPVDKHENNKHLHELFGEKNDELFDMFL